MARFNPNNTMIAGLKKLATNTSYSFSEEERKLLSDTANVLENPPKKAIFGVRMEWPWWSKTYFLGVAFLSSATYTQSGLNGFFIVAACGAFVAVISYGLYRWIRWCNGWNNENSSNSIQSNRW